MDRLVEDWDSRRLAPVQCCSDVRFDNLLDDSRVVLPPHTERSSQHRRQTARRARPPKEGLVVIVDSILRRVVVLRERCWRRGRGTGTGTVAIKLELVFCLVRMPTRIVVRRLESMDLW